MKQRILLLLLFPLLANGQPGGGGTISIHNIFDGLGNRISVENDTLLSIKCYLLNDTNFLSEDIYSEIDYNISESRNASILYYLESETYSNYRFLEFGGVSDFANFRLFIQSGRDTMIIDFVKVLGVNPRGINIHIDSLFIETGYFQYKKEDIFCINRPFDDCWVVRKASNYQFDLLIYDRKRPLKEYKQNQNGEWEK